MPGTDLKLYDIAQPRLCENGLANEVVSIVGQKKQRVHALAASSAVCVPLINPSPGHASGTNDAGTHGDLDIASPSRSEGSPYWGLSGARNWELIQPFQRVFSTWTQSPSRPVAVNCVPLGAVPRTGAFAEGADLMLTPGRCKKTRSGFCAVDVVWGVTAPTWGEAAAVSEAATSGEGTTPDAPGDGSATVGAGCT